MTGSAKPARCSSAPRSRRSANGATRGDTPPSISVSAAAKACAQFGQRVAADQRREKQSVGLERAADLDERARQIVDELQRQRRHHEIERAVAERQRFLVGGDRQTLAGDMRRDRIDRDDRAHLIRERAPHRVARRAEIDRQIEPSQHRGKPLREIVGDTVEQERRGPKRRRPRRRARSSVRSKITGCGIGPL